MRPRPIRGAILVRTRLNLSLWLYPFRKSPARSQRNRAGTGARARTQNEGFMGSEPERCIANRQQRYARFRANTSAALDLCSAFGQPPLPDRFLIPRLIVVFPFIRLNRFEILGLPSLRFDFPGTIVGGFLKMPGISKEVHFGSLLYHTQKCILHMQNWFGGSEPMFFDGPLWPSTTHAAVTRR